MDRHRPAQALGALARRAQAGVSGERRRGVEPLPVVEDLQRERRVGVFPAWGLEPDTPASLIATDDIGVLVRLILERPERFIGRTLEIAGDALTGPRIGEAFGRVVGRPVRLVARERRGTEIERMIAWFETIGRAADVPALRALHPGLCTLEAWLRRTGRDGTRGAA